MSIRAQALRLRFFAALTVGGAASLLMLAGCQSREAGPGRATTSETVKPNFGPPMQDVRTEAKIVEMENDYIAAKNSQPTHQHEVQAEAAKKAALAKQQKAPTETAK